jgi:ribosomal protein L35
MGNAKKFKHKPHKGTLKRIRVTKSGKVKGRVANGSHLRSGKTGANLRGMRKARYLVNKGITKRLTTLLGRRIATGREERVETVETATN